MRDILDYQTLIKIYLSIIQPHFDYCSQIWGCLVKELSDKLRKLQNRAFRIITRENYDTRTIDVLNKVGLPNLVTRRKHHLAVLMFKAKHNMLPNCLTELFTTSNEIHNYNTRQSEFNFALPKPKTNFMKKSFAYRGAETWNNLSADIKSKTSISTSLTSTSWHLTKRKDKTSLHLKEGLPKLTHAKLISRRNLLTATNKFWQKFGK